MAVKSKGPKRRSPTKRRHTGGKPALVVTDFMRDTVSMCRVLKLTDVQTARQVNYDKGGISIETLHKYFKPELDDDGWRLHLRIARNVAKAAADPRHKASIVASIFWLRANLGWQQPERTEFEFAFDGRKRVKGSAAPEPVVFTLKIGDRQVTGETIEGTASEDGDASE
jgi:hypothetical protein